MNLQDLTFDSFYNLIDSLENDTEKENFAKNLKRTSRTLFDIFGLIRFNVVTPVRLMTSLSSKVYHVTHDWDNRLMISFREGELVFKSGCIESDHQTKTKNLWEYLMERGCVNFGIEITNPHSHAVVCKTKLWLKNPIADVTIESLPFDVVYSIVMSESDQEDRIRIAKTLRCISKSFQNITELLSFDVYTNVTIRSHSYKKVFEICHDWKNGVVKSVLERDVIQTTDRDCFGKEAFLKGANNRWEELKKRKRVRRGIEKFDIFQGSTCSIVCVRDLSFE